MLAGKTAISKAMSNQAERHLVDGHNRKKANNISHMPLIKIMASCMGIQPGIICLYTSGCIRWFAPAAIKSKVIM